MRRAFVLLAAIGAILVPAPAAVNAQPGFVGYGCTISTCRYFTSSYHTAKYYYDRRTCSQWKSLSKTYLRGFTTVTKLHQYFPKRILHPKC